jgi:hypothetical protein
MDMVDFVRLVSTGTNELERSSDELLRWVLLRLSDGRQLLLAERSYRDGTKVLVEPTEEELQAARRDAWAPWNSERAEHVAGIDDPRNPYGQLMREHSEFAEGTTAAPVVPSSGRFGES